MFYTYICYWNIFQYKYTTQITFHVVKQSHARVTSKDICLLLHYFFAYFRFVSPLFYFRKLSSSFDVWLTPGPESSCLGFTSFNVPLIYSLKRPINYCCWIWTILCKIFKKRLFIEALCRPLFTKYAYCKSLFSFQNNA